MHGGWLKWFESAVWAGSMAMLYGRQDLISHSMYYLLVPPSPKQKTKTTKNCHVSDQFPDMPASNWPNAIDFRCRCIVCVSVLYARGYLDMVLDYGNWSRLIIVQHCVWTSHLSHRLVHNVNY